MARAAGGAGNSYTCCEKHFFRLKMLAFSELFSNLQSFPTNSPKDCLKRCGEQVFVDGPFEVYPVQVCFTFTSFLLYG